MHCDIARIDSIESTVKTAIDRLDGLHYLINCAGMSAKEKHHETDLASSDAILDTNLRAHLYFARYSLPEINRNARGAVIKIGSINHPFYLSGSESGFGRSCRGYVRGCARVRHQGLHD
jgi:NAD(P)-dependent dehydrogenase (short-subunit alcohol dehydrogenase family)